MKHTKLLISLLAIGSLYATNAKTSSTKALDTRPVNNVGLNDNQLTEKLLDSYWDAREEGAKQVAIAQYLLQQPVIPKSNYAIAWKTARLVYFIGNFGSSEAWFAKNKKTVSIAKLFNYGVNAGELATKINPKGVEGHYWYAVNLGSYGLAKGVLAAASKAGDGMDALKRVIKIDPSYQNYGAFRILGRYYHALPGFFGGSDVKAKNSFIIATQKAPNYKNNWIYLGNFYLDKGKYKEAKEACSKAINLPEADGKYENIRYQREAMNCLSSSEQNLKKS